MTEKMVTDHNFHSEVIASDIPVCVCFSASWCRPCKEMAPVVKELAEELKSKAKIVKMNVEDNFATTGEFGIMSVPTFLIFVKGSVKEQMNGVLTKTALKEKIEKYL